MRTLRGPLLTPTDDGLRPITDAVVRWDDVSGRVVDVSRWDDAPAADLDVRACGMVIPGFVDAHVHFPQYRVRGRFGGALLPWLQQHIWPVEARFADRAHAAAEAPVFLDALLRAGTTSAGIYGSPHPSSVEPLLGADRAPAMVAGPALMDRTGPQELLLEAAAAEAAMQDLADRFGDRVAVTPRFAVSCSEALLAACGRLARRDRRIVQTHLSENPDEIAMVAQQFPGSEDYLGVYEAAGLVGPHTLLAHAVHCSDSAYRRIAHAGATVVHCPTSNVALGSGRMPIERVVASGAKLCLGTDVGAGPDLGMLDVLRTFVDVHQGHYPTDASVTLPLATRAGALALGMADRGQIAAGMWADLAVLRVPGGAADPVRAFEDAVRGYRTGDEGAVIAVVREGELLEYEL